MKLLKFIGYLLMIALAACKPDSPNKEPYFKVEFISKDSSFILDSVFHQIYGISDGKLTSQIVRDSNVVYLPLNLTAKSASFYFEQEDCTDSLILTYHLDIVKRNNEYSALPEKVQVSGSFVGLEITCIEKSKGICNHAKEASVIF